MVNRRQVFSLVKRTGNDKKIEPKNQGYKSNNIGESSGAGNGDRTRGIKLGKLALCQLSYARIGYNIKRFMSVNQYL